MNLFLELRSIISDVLNVPEEDIDENFSIESCENWDSLAHMGLVTAIEEKFALELTMDDIVEMTSIEAMLNRLSGESARDT